MVSQTFRGLWGISPVRMISSVKNYSSFSFMTFLLIYFPKGIASYLWWHLINACRMEVKASQSERVKRTVSPAEILSPSLVSSFLLLWCLSVHCTNKVCPFSSCQPGNLLQLSHLLPDTVTQHTPPTPDGSLLLHLLARIYKDFHASRLAHGWAHPKIEALYEHQKRPKQSNWTWKSCVSIPFCTLVLLIFLLLHTNTLSWKLCYPQLSPEFFTNIQGPLKGHIRELKRFL